MKKVLHIIGTRPQIVKLASLINFKNINFQNLIIDTNQHYQKNMQEDLYDDFKISKEKITFLENNKNSSNDVDAIKEAIERLDKVTQDFAARRMDHSIRAALSGQNVDQL